MAVVRNLVKSPGGLLVAGAKIEVQLHPTDEGFVMDSDYRLIGPSTTKTDNSGLWQLDLEPNSRITPSGTVYRIREYDSKNRPHDDYYISVPNSSGPFWAGDIITSSPSSIPDPTTFLSNTTPLIEFGTGASGTSSQASRSDHVHPAAAGGGGGGASVGNTVISETGYGQSSAAGGSSLASRTDHSHGTPALTSTAPVSSAVGDVTAVGTGSTPARHDHKHAREAFGSPTAQITYGLSSGAGSSSSPARADHTHGTVPRHPQNVVFGKTGSITGTFSSDPWEPDQAITLTRVTAKLSVAPTAALSWDVRINAVSIFGAAQTIGIGATRVTFIPTTTAMVTAQSLTAHITAAGTGASGLVVIVYYTVNA